MLHYLTNALLCWLGLFAVCVGTLAVLYLVVESRDLPAPGYKKHLL